MGQRGGSQDRLFYSFSLDDQVLRGTCCAGSIDSLISAICATISRRSTATPGGESLRADKSSGRTNLTGGSANRRARVRYCPLPA
jgi:hypothetical protein